MQLQILTFRNGRSIHLRIPAKNKCQFLREMSVFDRLTGVFQKATVLNFYSKGSQPFLFDLIGTFMGRSFSLPFGATQSKV